MRLNGGCASDIGRSRKVNQDAILFQCIEDSGQYFALGAVCDGVGGLEYGERASRLVIREVKNWFDAIAAWIDIPTMGAEILYAHLLDGAEEWNSKVQELSNSDHIRTGTTMSLILIIREQYYIVQVGDSRIYKFRQSLEQLTTDATVSHLKNGRMKAYLANYMGKGKNLWFSALEGTFQEGDMFLFCSDGGYHMLREEDVRTIYAGYTGKTDLTEISRKLTELMLDRGERDNISIGIIMAEAQSGGRGKGSAWREKWRY